MNDPLAAAYLLVETLLHANTIENGVPYAVSRDPRGIVSKMTVIRKRASAFTSIDPTGLVCLDAGALQPAVSGRILMFDNRRG